MYVDVVCNSFRQLFSCFPTHFTVTLTALRERERERERENRQVWSVSACFQLLSCGVFQLSYFVIKKNSELTSKIWLRMNQWKQKTLQVWIQIHRKGRKELCNFGFNFVIKHMVDLVLQRIFWKHYCIYERQYQYILVFMLNISLTFSKLCKQYSRF